MLPPLLCEELCSLNPGVDRLAFSVTWRMRGSGELDASAPPWFGRTLIRSLAKLDYGTAQHCMDGGVTEAMVAAADAGDAAAIPEALWPRDRRPGPFDDGAEEDAGHTCAGVWGDLRLMHRVAMARRRKRFQAGALALNKVRAWNACLCMKVACRPPPLTPPISPPICR